ncbi:hypothetical protein, partial [Serratia liquefaciens]|uniref:hypothetical protein n=1 Tax=Serratia liquefaciens TaxID=614 RepID=UPI00390616B3
MGFSSVMITSTIFGYALYDRSSINAVACVVGNFNVWRTSCCDPLNPERSTLDLVDEHPPHRFQ